MSTDFFYQQQKAIEFERQIKSRVYEIAKKIGTRDGFFQYYFDISKRCSSNSEAFYLTNQIHYLIFNEYRYTSYTTFSKQKQKYLRHGK